MSLFFCYIYCTWRALQNKLNENILLKVVNKFAYIKYKHYLCSRKLLLILKNKVMDKKNNSAQSAQRENKQRVNNNAVKAETAKQTLSVACMPAVVETTKANKVEAKDALHSANVLKANVKEERRGANVTIRLIAEQAANGNDDAVNVLCSLCDVPKEFLFSITLDDVRQAVKSYYPYYIEDENRRISVKASGFWYTSAKDGEKIEDATKRVTRGFRAVPVEDYLEQLISAAKCRAKGIKPRRVCADVVYTDNKMSVESEGVTIAEINEAKARKAYKAGEANTWKKGRNGFYI